MICDFCSAPCPDLSTCNTVAAPNVDILAVGHPIGIHWDGDFLACAVCSEFIFQGQWSLLVARVIASYADMRAMCDADKAELSAVLFSAYNAMWGPLQDAPVGGVQ